MNVRTLFMQDMVKINKSSGRNTAIEALRFLSVFQICLWHMSCPVTAAGFLGVEFFFILAGIFLYKNATKVNSPGVVGYSLHKLSKFYFKLILAQIITQLVYSPGLLVELQDNWLRPVLRFISEALLLQCTGTFGNGLNGPTWFFSVLIYGGALVYALTKYYRHISIRVIFPLLCVCYFAYTFNNGTTETLERWDNFGPVPFILARGVSEMALGVLCGYIYFSYRQAISPHKMVLNISAVIALVLYLFIVAGNRSFSQYALIMIPIIICTALTEGTILQKLFGGRIWLFLGRISFDIFLIHFPLMAVFRHFLHVEAGMSLPVVAILYYLSLVPCAYIFDIVAQKLSGVLFMQHKIRLS